MTLEHVENMIYAEYMRWHTDRPDIKPREAGYLGQLWREFDRLIELEGY